ncbi:MAG: hypothetical protein M1554_02530 [Patescibacteria group bacterium]|jgi:hypothetical protein|nr:hypothetical protein [Patescibacteria group bacterium]
MLNLLPPDIKLSYKYAKQNVKLRNWAIAFLLAIGGLGIILSYGLFTISKNSNSYNNQINSLNHQLASEHLSSVRAQVVDISNSLNLAIKVLGNEILFSKLIQQIGAVMPNGSVLTGLNINQIQGGITLNALSTNYQTATQTQVNLSAPSNGIFSKVDIVNISCSGQGASSNPSYPCSIELRALFNTDNQFLFINQGNKK